MTFYHHCLSIYKIHQAATQAGTFVCVNNNLEILIFLSIFDSFCLVYIRATAVLCIITLITDAIATLLTGFGLRTQDHNLKYKFYRIAVLIMMVACK
jgi:hypothetical protein